MIPNEERMNSGVGAGSIGQMTTVTTVFEKR